MKIKKLICLLLALSIIMLTGCGADDAATVAQEEMDEQTLQNTLEYIEYMGLLAAVDTQTLTDGYRRPAYIGDGDGDGSLELFYGDMRYIIFEKAENNTLHYTYTQGGGFVVDANGLCYVTDTLGGPHFDNFDTEIGWDGYTYYSQWNGTGYDDTYTKEFVYYYDESRPDSIYWYAGTDRNNEVPADEAATLNFSDGNGPDEYAMYTFESRYHDHVVQSLLDTLTTTYNKCSSAKMDIDADGIEDTVISIPDIVAPWIRNIDQDDAVYPNDPLTDIIECVTNIDRGFTSVIVISTKGETTTVSASAIPHIVFDDAQNMSFYKNGFIHGGYSAYIPLTAIDFASIEGTERSEVLSSIDGMFNNYGYFETVYKIADVADTPGDEIICFVRLDDGLYADILNISDGAINFIYQDFIGHSSYYLVNHGGTTHVLTYSQSLGSGYDLTISYSYSLFRYTDTNADTYFNIVDSEYVSYSTSQSDATTVSDFFTKLNVYLEGDLTVLYDKYSLTGKEWMELDDIDYGERPRPTEDVSEEGTLGFVKVYAHTWLNLREGPGTQYDRVLLDPNDPQSFVKQALGSPVTILEEIETGDPENPVWVRIRIVYQDQVLEGYSSKRYIKVVGEQ